MITTFSVEFQLLYCAVVGAGLSGICVALLELCAVAQKEKEDGTRVRKQSAD